jgi:DNA-binding NarL/FixJ family response regulator
MKSGHQTLTVLLIEENPADARMVRRMLAAPALAETYDVVHFECIDQAMDRLDDPDVDAIMIGMEAPDRVSPQVLKAIRAHVPVAATIVLVRSADEEFAVETVRAGAQDCLFKDELDGIRISRSLRCGIERSKMSPAGGDPAASDGAREEMEAWAAMCSPAPLRVARKSFGQTSLKEAAPGVFGDLVRHYQDILDRSLEERAVRTNKEVVEELKSLADRLGGLDASPTDVVDLHMATMTAKLHGQPLKKAKAYVAEGRLLLLKLMGDLASFYRTASWGKSPSRGGRLPASRAKPIHTLDPATTQKPAVTQKKDGQ